MGVDIQSSLMNAGGQSWIEALCKAFGDYELAWDLAVCSPCLECLVESAESLG